jgi:hypothetical protein
MTLQLNLPVSPFFENCCHITAYKERLIFLNILQGQREPALGKTMTILKNIKKSYS